MSVARLLLAAVACTALTPPIRAQERVRFPAASVDVQGTHGFSQGDLDSDGLLDLVTRGGAGVQLWQATSPVSFRAPTTLTSDFANHILVTDLDGDGRDDVVGTFDGEFEDSVRAYQQLPSGDFVMHESFAPSAHHVSTADFDGDGRYDALVAPVSVVGTTTWFMRGEAPFGFSPLIEEIDAGGPAQIADLDLDGDLDFISVQANPDTVYVVENLGGAVFGTPVQIVHAGMLFTNLGELTGDGVPDLLVGTWTELFVTPGQGDLSFGAPLASPSLAPHVITSPAVLADLDLDGDLDLSLGAEDDHNREVLLTRLNDGTGVLSDEWTAAAARHHAALTVADVNGDALPDVRFRDNDGADLVLLPGLGDGTFAAPVDLGGDTEDAAQVGDVDGDGILDVISLLDDETLRVQRGLGDGTFAAPVTTPSPFAASAEMELAGVGDIDDDGDLDVVMLHLDLPVKGISVLLGSGTLTFQAGPISDLGFRPFFPRVADMDDDGHIDVVGFKSAARLQFCPGDGTGVFDDAGSVLVSSQDRDIGDLDLDGDLEVVVGFSWPYELRTYDLGPAGTPFLHASQDSPVNPQGLALGDSSGDGVLDVGVSSDSQRDVYVAEGVGDGTFQPATFAGTFVTTTADLAMADLDGDGAAELIGSALGVSVLPSLGSLGFDAPTFFAPRADYARATDFNADGLLDLLLLDTDEDEASALINGYRGSWWNLGHALPAVGKPPRLVGHGNITTGGTVALRSTGNAPFSAASLVLGLSELDAAFKGGVLVPQPDLVVSGLLTDVDGSLLIPLPLPALTFGGLPLWWQLWVSDAGGPAGFTATNGLQMVLP